MDRRRLRPRLDLAHQGPRIRYRTDELAALAGGHLFCLADGNANLDQITQRFLDAMPAIHHAIQNTDVGFWHVHTSGRITKMWP